MAHFAELDENNIVKRVVVISNDDIIDKKGKESEDLGIQVCKNIFGAYTNWVQTSYNGNFRKKYAAIGDRYEVTADVFYPSVGPFPSWTLDSNYDWQPPVPYPTDGKSYYWDEDTLNWIEIGSGE